MSSLRRLLLVSLVSPVSVLSGAGAEDARVSPAVETAEWELPSPMHLHLAARGTEALQRTYSVYPLTEPAGLNLRDRSSIRVHGSLVPVEVLAGANLRKEETIVFLGCDNEIATATLNEVMGDRPKAILLYSLELNACRLDADDLRYVSFYTMGDADAAQVALNNTLRAGGVLRATITGGEIAMSTVPGSQGTGGRNSAVAMSILYSITGLITLLFLVIIGTGAVRAHRYPERYGPRSGFGGRPPQSRARGLARAVLETLPIVKFGDPEPAKPDPSLELESQPPATAPDASTGTRLSAIPEESRTPAQVRQSAAPMSGAVPEPDAPAQARTPADGTGQEPDKDGEGANPGAVSTKEHLGCPICTEDFTVGEDVRVLPCNHKFHPPCIDPWLVNFSGTCPLCRLDLRPQDGRSSTGQHPESGSSADNNHNNDDDNSNNHDNEADADGRTQLSSAPPSAASQRHRRSSRFLDIHRLRHASVEERIEILRRHRSRQLRRESSADGADMPEQGQPQPQPQPQQRARRTGRLLGWLRLRRESHSPSSPPPPSPPPPSTQN
ncbi:hypothetical protein VTH06DRAFT_1387 [Thermothelomyces fergusii]